MSLELALIEKLNFLQKHHKEQLQIKRSKNNSHWQHTDLPLPHRFAATLAKNSNSVTFLDNLAWPQQLANLGYCAHFSNGYFDCCNLCVESTGKLLKKYCVEHEKAYQFAQKLHELEIAEFIEKQQQELVQLLRDYKTKESTQAAAIRNRSSDFCADRFADAT